MFLVILPIDSADKRSLAQLKKRLVGQSYSDQLVVLKIFRVSILFQANRRLWPTFVNNARQICLLYKESLVKNLCCVPSFADK
jgi:hypothetical protein